ncbi:MAG: 3-isopropylmalate dehydratase small subunit [Candidatus Aenigmarchaeota archaeon]|nr:3-isopropylmalate dehydratase small subunit [Candidatus Aenigmarchaeota archaeon]
MNGKAHVFGDYVNTDLIIPFRFKARTNDPVELAKYCMYGIDREFPKKVSKGDVIVAGVNFGGGSSREQAPVAIKYAGIGAVVADSFARIFFRNALVIGLPALEIPGIQKQVKAGDAVAVDLRKRTLTNLRTKKTFQAAPLTGFLRDLEAAGGLAAYHKRHGKFPWEPGKRKTT